MTSDSENLSKRLYLLRHALALPAESGGEDIKRALAPRGVEDAKALAAIMRLKGYLPDYALCSPAVRTRQTLEPIEERITLTDISRPMILYTGSPGDLLATIQKVSPSFEQVILSGHNPGIGQLAKLLTGRGGESLVQRLNEGFRPGTLAVFAFAGDDWAEVQPGGLELTDFMDPLDYNAPSTPARWT